MQHNISVRVLVRRSNYDTLLSVVIIGTGLALRLRLLFRFVKSQCVSLHVKAHPHTPEHDVLFRLQVAQMCLNLKEPGRYIFPCSTSCISALGCPDTLSAC